MADRDDLEDRVPCSDEMCVGIIGPGGRCGVCGKPGTPPSSGRTEHPHDDLHGASTAAPEPAPQPRPEVAAPATTAPDGTPDPEDRVPCPDEMCVGILSPQGRCGTCGRVWPVP